MAVEQAHAGNVAFTVGGGRHQACGIFCVKTSRFVQQDGRGFDRFELRVGVDLDLLGRHHRLGFLHHHAIDGHPAAFDVLLGFDARTAEQVGDKLVEADGFGHAVLLGGGRPV